MNQLPLSIRIEKAFATDYLPRHLSITGLHIYEGHEAVGKIQLPYLIVYAEDAQQHPEMPVTTGIRNVRLKMKFAAASDAGRGMLDAWKDQLERAMLEQRCIAELNSPPSGVDRRKVSDIYVYDILHAGETSGRDDLDWEEDCIYEIVCQKL